MYFVTKESLPMTTFNKLLELQRLNVCPDLQEKSRYYTSGDSHNDMLDLINDVLEESILNDINSSSQLGLIIDETTDVTIYKKLSIYVKVLNNTTPVIHFMDNVTVNDGKAETLVSAIETAFTNRNIPINKIHILATDGASVMMGRKGGVGAILIERHCPALIQIHCITHRVALAAGQACRDVPYFTEYQLLLKQLFRYFNNSAIRYNNLRSLQQLIETDDNIKTLSLKKPASFRWLSLGSAVDAIFSSYSAIYTTLDNQAANKDAEAKGLLLKVKSVSFVLTTAFLVDVLACVNNLSLAFQKEDVNISTVLPQIRSTIERLSFFKQKDGTTLRQTYTKIKDGNYHDLQLNGRQTLRMQFQNSAQLYITNIVDNLTQRFDEDSLGILQTLNNLLNPCMLPADHTIMSYGEDLLGKVTEYFSNRLPVDETRLDRHYMDVKLLLRQHKTMPFQQPATYFLDHYYEQFPDFAHLFTLLLIAPVTSVVCERGFSCQNRIKTKLRCNLLPETVSKLIRIQQDGPNLKEFDSSKTHEKFMGIRKRRKCNV